MIVILWSACSLVCGTLRAAPEGSTAVLRHQQRVAASVAAGNVSVSTRSRYFQDRGSVRRAGQEDALPADPLRPARRLNPEVPPGDVRLLSPPGALGALRPPQLVCGQRSAARCGAAC